MSQNPPEINLDQKYYAKQRTSLLSDLNIPLGLSVEKSLYGVFPKVLSSSLVMYRVYQYPYKPSSEELNSIEIFGAFPKW